MQLLRRQVLALIYLDVVLKLQTEHTGQSGIDQIGLYVCMQVKHYSHIQYRSDIR